MKKWKKKKTTKQDAKEKGSFMCRIASVSTHETDPQIKWSEWDREYLKMNSRHKRHEDGIQAHLNSLTILRRKIS